uniref:Uncharacterized protein n=1 Tax=Arundo donax TaxID=35708 RepID=A0A0A9HCR0_ARUDO
MGFQLTNSFRMVKGLLPKTSYITETTFAWYYSMMNIYAQPLNICNLHIKKVRIIQIQQCAVSVQTFYYKTQISNNRHMQKMLDLEMRFSKSTYELNMYL